MSRQDVFCFRGRSFFWFKSSGEHPRHSPAYRLSSGTSSLFWPSAPATLLDLTFLTIPPAPGHLLLLFSWPECLSPSWTLPMAISFLSFKSQLKCYRGSFPDHPSSQTTSCPDMLNSLKAHNSLCSSGSSRFVKIYLCDGRFNKLIPFPAFRCQHYKDKADHLCFSVYFRVWHLIGSQQIGVVTEQMNELIDRGMNWTANECVSQ